MNQQLTNDELLLKAVASGAIVVDEKMDGKYEILFRGKELAKFAELILQANKQDGELRTLLKETRDILFQISGSALLAGEKCKTPDKGIIYKMICEANNNLSYCETLLDKE